MTLEDGRYTFNLPDDTTKVRISEEKNEMVRVAACDDAYQTLEERVIHVPEEEE